MDFLVEPAGHPVVGSKETFSWRQRYGMARPTLKDDKDFWVLMMFAGGLLVLSILMAFLGQAQTGF